MDPTKEYTKQLVSLHGMWQVLGSRRVIGAVLALLLLLTGACLRNDGASPQSATGNLRLLLPGQAVWKNGASSFLFGTNDTYEWSEHNIETEAAIQQALRRAGVTLIRTFFPDGASDVAIEQRMRTIENAGAHCLGVITNITHVAFDEHLVRYLGPRCQLYELGNEPDYDGMAVSDYLKAWNFLIPRLRSINPAARFIGPVTANDAGNHLFLREYLAGVKASQVLPDAISFHWYPCWQNTRDECLAMANSFTQAVADVRSFIHNILGRDLPIGITEWNYDPGNPPPAYGDDSSFMTKFTTTALLAMARAGVAFACQFDAASYSGYGRLDMFDLDSNQPKPQYYAMASLIAQYRPEAPTPSTAAATPSAAKGADTLISLNKPVYCSQANSGPGGPAALVDGRFGAWAFWELATSALPGWCAIKVGQGPSKVLVSWVSDFTFDYISDQGLEPQRYTLSVSANSTDGVDGTWRQVASVQGNHARMREHLLPFTGMSWVKMMVTSAQPRASQPVVRIHEIEVYDASAGTNDTFFFSGASITAIAYDRSDAHQPSFARDVHAALPQLYPLMLDGGMGGWGTDGAVQYIGEWLALNPDMHYWLLGWGSNDALSMVSPTHFHDNLQQLVTSITAAGRVPILAHLPYSTFHELPGLDQEIKSLNAVIDQVTAANHLIAGPDFYALFRSHPAYLSADGLHPSDEGAVAMNAAWFQVLRAHLHT